MILLEGVRMIEKIKDGGAGLLHAIKKITFPNRLFLVLAIVFGLLMINTVPPIQAPDEIGHFIKAYAFSEFKVKPMTYNKKLKKTDNTWGNYGFEVPYEMKSEFLRC